jgi:hypothetical protein
MRILSLIVVAAILGLAEPAHATTIMGPVIPTLDQVITPAGVSEYKEAMTVALVRPHRAWTPPCALVRAADFFRDAFNYPWLGADACGPRERSRRYRFETLETFKGSPPGSFPALLYNRYPLDPDFMRKTRPDLWIQVFDADARRAAQLHAGFSFLHHGRFSDRYLRVGGPFDKPRMSDGGVSYPMLDPDLDYLVFRDADGSVQHWEPIQRGSANKDLLIDRMRWLKRGETDVRLTVAPADLFARFTDAAIYDASHCKPRLVGGGKLKVMDEFVRETFGSPQAGPATCEAKPHAQLYLALAADPATPDTLSIDESGAAIRLLPITDGKIRPSDLVSQLRVASDAPIPVEQLIAWVGTGPGADEHWFYGRPKDPPLKLAKR